MEELSAAVGALCLAEDECVQGAVALGALGQDELVGPLGRGGLADIVDQDGGVGVCVHQLDQARVFGAHRLAMAHLLHGVLKVLYIVGLVHVLVVVANKM